MNGGLFAADIIIPQFTQDTRFILLQEASADFDWSGISPTIFGAVFESTLNPETRRSGGMHYTSVANIHKLTGPLFYDALKDELTAIEGLKVEKERRFKLNAFRKKIAGLKFLDPACGSGNFLTETYLSLRKLENRVLEDIYGGQMVMGDLDPIQVSLDQFYGIEVNDFAVEVAKTALWIAELQMLDQTREILSMWIDPLPLKSNDNIVCANALRTDWSDVLPASDCDYIIGNPPFVGKKEQKREQKQELLDTFHGARVGNLDYVACWYMKAAEYMEPRTLCAFVSTNSISQGEQPSLLWPALIDKGITIDFCWRSFVWDSEAADKAHVHVVIVGFSKSESEKRIYSASKEPQTVATINPYLSAAPMALVKARGNPLCDVTEMSYGSMPIDNGSLILDRSAMESVVSCGAGKIVREYIGGDELINRKQRWCLWISNEKDYMSCPIAIERVEMCRVFRNSSKRPQTAKAAETPYAFGEIRQPDTQMLVVPKVSSERRAYLPIGFIPPTTIVNGSALIVPDADKFTFGVLSSQVHNAWMRVVAGRMKSDYQYSASIVYNNFVWPKPTTEQRTEIELRAQAVLDAREAHPDRSLAEMYDGISPMPENPSKADQKKYAQREYDDLKAAHAALDAAVEVAYGVDFGGDEEKIVAHLFKLYAETVDR